MELELPTRRAAHGLTDRQTATSEHSKSSRDPSVPAPLSCSVQEKLWKAITSDAAEKRKQDDLEKASQHEVGVPSKKKGR